ncbi:DUF4412 domain-containing protein [uncultured Winogradskyella sp.]|uniref:DUF4412 domain-containing protein n=1 Tax=uncultured Winogradskyella sp. TaxID=395353 RepID=UPI00262780C9|nr:DUF4412 domain-containing protein [uncultured Winogradskyella sp.]
MKKLVILGLSLIMGFTTIAQEKFTEGKIIMSQTMSTDNEQMQAMLKQMMGDEPMTIVTYLKGDKSRSEISNPASGDIITISNNDTKEMLMLMDNPMLGKKYQLTSLNIEDEEKLEENVKIVQGDNTKTILGYECKEQIVTVNQNGVKMEMSMYITDKITPVMTQQTSMLGNKLKGFPMYMIMNMNQQGMAMKMTFEVIELTKESVANSKFNMTPPEGYTKLQAN